MTLCLYFPSLIKVPLINPDCEQLLQPYLQSTFTKNRKIVITGAEQFR